jgi:hypothetical protein
VTDAFGLADLPDPTGAPDYTDPAEQEDQEDQEDQPDDA